MADQPCWQQTAAEALPVMYKLAAGMLSPHDAQDAVQSALMKTWERREQIRPDACRAYLMRTLINECRTIQRRHMRVTPVQDFPATPAPEDRSEEVREVMEAIALLPEHLRVTLMLKVLEDYSDQQAARVLGVPLAVYRSRLHRARVALRKMLRREVVLE